MCLRDLSPRHPRANVGDALINEGVASILRTLGDIQVRWLDRSAFEIPPSMPAADMLVYAGMPQFGARSEPTQQERAWERLRNLWGVLPLGCLNFGCGTGYSALSNRLEVAADMARYAFNQRYYRGQADVTFAPRDPLSWHFLSMIGLEPELLLCPSGFHTPAPVHPRRRIAITLLNPQSKLGDAERNHLPYDLFNLFRRLIEANPDALVIGQQATDRPVIEALKIKNWVIPETVEAFTEACGSGERLISFRVHGTVCALLQKRPVLHFAIDGRSDLLTPYIAAGLWKRSIFRSSITQDLETANLFASETNVSDCAGIVAQQREAAIALVKRKPRIRQVAAPAPIGARVVDPRVISTLAAGDEIVLTPRSFAANAALRNDQLISFPVAGIGQHCIYGPYALLPKGDYRAIFDIEFWGRLHPAENAEITFDVVDGSDRSLSVHKLPVRSLMTTDRLPMLDFHHSNEGRRIELRIDVSGATRDLDIDFYGVRLLRR